MRKRLIIILYILMLVGLTACDADERQKQETDAANIKIEELNRKTPSEDIIIQDLTRNLQFKNEHAKILEADTVKSLTDENTFLITLSVKAKSKYADWIYDVDLHYRKYDQGWMLESTIWNQENYSLFSAPNLDTMVDIATESLSQRIDKESPQYEYHDYNHALLPITNPEMKYDESVNSEMITMCWNTDDILIGFVHRFTTTWTYDSSADNWILEDIGFSVVSTPFA